METSGEGSNPSDRATPRPLAQLQELETRVARRRLSQAHHRATLAGLFSNLRKTVYSQSDLTASKVWGPGCGEKFLQVEGLRSEVGAGLELPPTPEGCSLGGVSDQLRPSCCCTWVNRESWAFPTCCRHASRQYGVWA